MRLLKIIIIYINKPSKPDAVCIYGTSHTLLSYGAVANEYDTQTQYNVTNAFLSVFIVEHLDKNSSNIMIYIAAKYNNK
jgi:hypothetical protein